MKGENNKLYGYSIAEGGWLEDFLTYYQDPEWSDGERMTIYPPRASGEIISFSKSHCIKGSEEGQNINYYYCNVGYSKTTTDISGEGEIGKTTTISYNIKLTLEEKEHLRTIRGTSIDRYNIISSTCIIL